MHVALPQDQPFRPQQPHQEDGREEVPVRHVLCAAGGPAAAWLGLWHGHLRLQHLPAMGAFCGGGHQTAQEEALGATTACSLTGLAA